MYHVLKLFHSTDATDAIAANLPVYCENYEEIVFQDPTVVMHNLLVKKITPYVSGEWKHHTDCKEYLSLYNFTSLVFLFVIFNLLLHYAVEKLKVDTVRKLQDAKKLIQKEVEDQKAKLKLAQETLSKFKDAVMRSRKATPATSYLATVSKFLNCFLGEIQVGMRSFHILNSF